MTGTPNSDNVEVNKVDEIFGQFNIAFNLAAVTDNVEGANLAAATAKAALLALLEAETVEIHSYGVGGPHKVVAIPLEAIRRLFDVPLH